LGLRRVRQLGLLNIYPFYFETTPQPLRRWLSVPRGKVFLCGHIAYLVPENPEGPLFSENTTLNATSEIISQPDMFVAVAILIAIIAVIVISIVVPVVIIKKKRKDSTL
jgi:hypothetical protein